MGDCNSTNNIINMAPVTNQGYWTPSMSSASSSESSLRSANHYAGSDEWPTDKLSSPDDGVKVIKVGVCNTFSLRFYGTHSTEPDGKKFKVRLWGLTNLTSAPTEGCDTLGDWLGDLEVTLGSAEVDCDNVPVSGATSGWAKEIAVLYDKTLYPGMRQVSRGELGVESVPILVLDGMGYAGFVIQMVKAASTPADSFGFIHRVF